MDYLLDTCTLLWLTRNPDRLSDLARQRLSSPAAKYWVSDVSCLELEIKINAGKLALEKPLRLWFEEQAALWKWNALAISRTHLYQLETLDKHHLDPFDRLLVTQALVERMPILTPDPWIARYPIQVIW